MSALFIIFIFAALALACRAIPEDFTFPADVDDPAALPPEVRSLYIKQTDGKHVIDPTMRKRLDTSGLSKSLDSERKKSKDHERFVLGFRALGLGDTPEEALEAITRARDDADDGSASGDRKVVQLDQLRAKLKEEFETTLKTEVGKKDEQLTKMQRTLHKNFVEREAIAALAKLKGSSDLLLPHVVGRLSLVEDSNGEFVVRVVDKDGDPVGDGLGGFKTAETLVSEMRSDERYARAFEATGKSGSGSRSTNNGSRHMSTGSDENKSAVSKIASGLATLR